MNIWEREARDIKAFLERNGYEASLGPDHVVVKDPVWSWGCGSKHAVGRIVEYKDVKVRDWPAAMKFVSERS